MVIIGRMSSLLNQFLVGMVELSITKLVLVSNSQSVRDGGLGVVFFFIRALFVNLKVFVRC